MKNIILVLLLLFLGSCFNAKKISGKKYSDSEYTIFFESDSSFVAEFKSLNGIPRSDYGIGVYSVRNSIIRLVFTDREDFESKNERVIENKLTFFLYPVTDSGEENYVDTYTKYQLITNDTMLIANKGVIYYPSRLNGLKVKISRPESKKQSEVLLNGFAQKIFFNPDYHNYLFFSDSIQTVFLVKNKFIVNKKYKYRLMEK